MILRWAVFEWVDSFPKLPHIHSKYDVYCVNEKPKLRELHLDNWYKDNRGGLSRLYQRLRRTCRARLVKLYVLTMSQQEEILDKVEDAWFEGKISGFECSSAPGTEEYETSFVNYVAYHVLPYKAVDYFRAKKNLQAENYDDLIEGTVLNILGDVSADPASIQETSQLHEVLKRCAEHLSDTLRQVYNLYIKDNSQQEIADHLSIKLGTVKSRTSEMIRKLGECVHAHSGSLGR